MPDTGGATVQARDPAGDGGRSARSPRAQKPPNGPCPEPEPRAQVTHHRAAAPRAPPCAFARSRPRAPRAPHVAAGTSIQHHLVAAAPAAPTNRHWRGGSPSPSAPPPKALLSGARQSQAPLPELRDPPVSGRWRGPSSCLWGTCSAFSSLATDSTPLQPSLGSWLGFSAQGTLTAPGASRGKNKSGPSFPILDGTLTPPNQAVFRAHACLCT